MSHDDLTTAIETLEAAGYRVWQPERDDIRPRVYERGGRRYAELRVSASGGVRVDVAASTCNGDWCNQVDGVLRAAC